MYSGTLDQLLDILNELTLFMELLPPRFLFGWALEGPKTINYSLRHPPGTPLPLFIAFLHTLCHRFVSNLSKIPVAMFGVRTDLSLLESASARLQDRENRQGTVRETAIPPSQL